MSKVLSIVWVARQRGSECGYVAGESDGPEPDQVLDLRWNVSPRALWNCVDKHPEISRQTSRGS